MQRLMIPILFLIASLAQISMAAPAFEAICEPKDMRTWYYMLDLEGAPVAYGWNPPDEKFIEGGPWVFSYAGGDAREMFINDSPAIVTGDVNGIIIAVRIVNTMFRAGAWTYVIHTGLRMIAASEVGGHSVAGSSIKARSVSFKCTFGF